ncbi:hypothetical protein [Parabacteroides sp. PF5-6]|uniref:hypothetical protein n=1 Tax=Parabacteroides sp. PF5-6 TaxID=1742403 RepID=UPI0024060452|nr:hypothetical protein [Parabacteroides sp. PF5-6]MDF9830600.1 hypothetical protein [Parabacteroides sp. PF5-6]
MAHMHRRTNETTKQVGKQKEQLGKQSEKETQGDKGPHMLKESMRLFNRKNLPYWVGAMILVSVICFVLLLFSEIQIPTVFTSSGIVAIISAFIGVLMTVLVTAILLEKQAGTQNELLKTQSQKEAEKDKDVKVFEEKLKIYKEFFSKLHEVVQEGKITPSGVEKLIFQISYLNMHTRSERVNKILGYLQKALNRDESDEAKYKILADNVFYIGEEMQQELYGKKLGDEIVDTKIFDALISDFQVATGKEPKLDEVITLEEKIEIQTYFWKELIEQIKSMGITSPIEWSDSVGIEESVRKYYEKMRNRHRYFGFSFDVYESKETSRKVGFYVEIDNDYYYGFSWNDEPRSDESLSQIVKRVSPSHYKSNQHWAGWRWPNYSNSNPDISHDLNFWKMSPNKAMERLCDKSTRKAFVKEVAQEMVEQINKFIEIAKENNL